ncbi:FAD-binding protein [Pontibacter sp. G13]|uniref:FAD-binding protein n=1 Tax=Pontibacter sp. G13 TaxID=3074898 RepID=UPI002889C0FA|nr:FAD-binding protein [Pontibacter sp. G13]WNJ19915.1 FAD-binding protein [Pontibacter sp. G13]
MDYAIRLSANHSIQEDFSSGNTLQTQDFSIQCWLKTTASGPLVLHHSQQSGTFFLLEIIARGHVQFSVQTPDGSQAIVTDLGGIDNGAWWHLTARKQGNQLSLFANGKQTAVTETTMHPLGEQVVEGIMIGKNLMRGNLPQFFEGEMGEVSVWDRPLSDAEITKFYHNPAEGNEAGLVSLYPFQSAEQGQSLSSQDHLVKLPEQRVTLEIKNNSPNDFTLSLPDILTRKEWPAKIPAHATVKVELENARPCFSTSITYQVEASEGKTFFTIDINKSLTDYDSFVRAEISPDLEREVKIDENKPLALEATLLISENLVIVNARHLNQFLQAVIPAVGKEHVVTAMDFDEKTRTAESTAKQIITYNQACQIFNRRIQTKPLAIVYCQNKDDVAITFKKAKEFNLPIRVRSGGHDHEGECMGTNTIVIDMMGLDTLNEFTANRDHVWPISVAEVGAGNRFIRLTAALAQNKVMIPHGTCATVAIPGFLMGGGWGPWTRKEGMCCEHLIGAEIVLGDGTIETVAMETLTAHADGRDVTLLRKNKPELLWALKGGGGMSYGIVTKFFIQTFKLPDTLIKFELEWNPYDTNQVLTGNLPTLKILTQWEQAINSASTPDLTGTNLKINGKPYTGSFDPESVVHNCLMYGYWEGKNREQAETSLRAFIQQFFTDHGVKPADIRIDGIGGLGDPYQFKLGAWDRESFHHVQLRSQSNSSDPLPYPPDFDEPAPHKITSRLVDHNGLGDAGRAALLRSLTSELILAGNRSKGMFNYVTLGAIAGDFYRKMTSEQKEKSAFPYKDKQYTIQYQTWWNLQLEEKEKLQDNPVYTRVNRALDWMEVCRDYDIPNTSGAFISFKDDSIPTKTYFAQSYKRLIEIKDEYSKDPDNHFRTRKTII